MGVRHRPPRLTMGRMMKLVAFAAVASACVAPAVRLTELGVGSPLGFVVMEAIAVPLALAVVAFVLVRGGPPRDWAIRILLSASVAAAFATAVGVMAFAFRVRAWRGGPFDRSFLVGDSLAIALLGFALVLLTRRVIPRRCPDCRRPALLADSTLRLPPDRGSGYVYQCLLCGDRFGKDGEGSWVPVEVGPL